MDTSLMYLQFKAVHVNIRQAERMTRECSLQNKKIPRMAKVRVDLVRVLFETKCYWSFAKPNHAFRPNI